MDTDSEENKRASFDGVFRYMGLLMPVIYIAIGLGFIVRPNDIFTRVPSQYSIPAGCLMIVYGVYRSYRIIQKLISE